MGCQARVRDSAIIAGLEQSALLTRGVVPVPEDLALADWPECSTPGELTTIGIDARYRLRYGHLGYVREYGKASSAFRGTPLVDPGVHSESTDSMRMPCSDR
jgi:hypothetical protein